MQTLPDIMDLAKRTAKRSSQPPRKSKKVLSQVNKTKNAADQCRTTSEHLDGSKVFIEPNIFDNFLPNLTTKK